MDNILKQMFDFFIPHFGSKMMVGAWDGDELKVFHCIDDVEDDDPEPEVIVHIRGFIWFNKIFGKIVGVYE